MWPWVLSWALFCCLKNDFWPQSHDATGRILFHIKIKVSMCTPVFETPSHKWLKLFATKDLNSRWNITDESYNPVKDMALIPYTIKRHVPSSKFLNCKTRLPCYAMEQSPSQQARSRAITHRKFPSLYGSWDSLTLLTRLRFGALTLNQRNQLCPLWPWRSQIH